MEQRQSPTQRPEITSEHLSKVVAEIFLYGLTPKEREDVKDVQTKIIDPSDLGGQKLEQDLRQELSELDTPEGYEETKRLARGELRLLPPDFLEQILEHFKELVKNLPAGHSKGHFLRDTINLLGILRDPKFDEKIDEVELLVGIVAGVFHDIGNSIVDRYKDKSRIGAHAEVGAVVFGKYAKGVIPPNLTKLIKYAIAAHTNYSRDGNVTLENGIELPRTPYIDEAEGDNRESMQIARQTDRLDLTNFAHVVRDILVHVEPIQDFNRRKNSFIKYDFLSSLSFDAKKGMGVINHEVTFDKFFSHDSKYFTQALMVPGAGDLALLYSVIAPDKAIELIDDIERNDPTSAAWLREQVKSSEESISVARNRFIMASEIPGAVATFKNICRVVEPAEDLESRLESFEQQFQLLPTEDQKTWTRGFLFMADVLMERWMNRLDSFIQDPHLGSKITSTDPAIQAQFEEHGRHLYNFAQQIMLSMKELAAQV